MNQPQIVGILNCTPDSFYDGGRYPSVESLIARGIEMTSCGADWIDVGGESTRPGAAPVSVGEEIERVIPVIEGLTAKGVRGISIDTTKSVVAREAIRAGATMINDVSGLRADPDMARILAPSPLMGEGRGEGEAVNDIKVILMHSRGSPQNMQQLTQYEEVVSDVISELQDAVAKALSAGIDRSNIILDPGFGFAKTADQSRALLRELGKFCGLGFPVMVGVSRKSFIGEAVGEKNPENRLAGSLAAASFAFLQGAAYFRVHDVKETAQALRLMKVLIDSPLPIGEREG